MKQEKTSKILGIYLQCGLWMLQLTFCMEVTNSDLITSNGGFSTSTKRNIHDIVDRKATYKMGLGNTMYKDGKNSIASYSEAEALRFVYHASAAYCANVSYWDCKSCQNLKDFTFFTQFYNMSTNTMGYMGYYSANKVVTGWLMLV